MISPRQILANHLIPCAFKICGGQEVWCSKQGDLSNLGIESFLVEPAHDIRFPSQTDWNTQKESLPPETIHFHDSYVYKLDQKTFGDCTKRWGVIVLPGRRPLMTGFSRQRFYLAAMLPRNPWKIRREKIILCPEPYPSGTYGDMLNISLPRLCRILSILPEREKAEACVALPFGRLETAHRMVEKLGIPRERHIDTLSEQFGLAKGGAAYTVNTPLKIMAGRRDYTAMRQALCPEHTNRGRKRIYIRRQSTRRVLNEDRFLPQLLDLGFIVFDERPRTLEEQMEFFHGAEIIIGAHGAGQANMLWSNPDVRMLEIRDAGWWINCFRLWSLYNGAPHYLMVDRSRFPYPTWDMRAFHTDLRVDPHRLLLATEDLLKLPAPSEFIMQNL